MVSHAEGENAVRIKERGSGWKSKKDFKIEVDNKTIFLFSMDSDTYSCRAFCEAVLEHTTPVDIIWTRGKEETEKFITDLDRLTRLTYKLQKRYGL